MLTFSYFTLVLPNYVYCKYSIGFYIVNTIGSDIIHTIGTSTKMNKSFQLYFKIYCLFVF